MESSALVELWLQRPVFVVLAADLGIGGLLPRLECRRLLRSPGGRGKAFGRLLLSARLAYRAGFGSLLLAASRPPLGWRRCNQYNRGRCGLWHRFRGRLLAGRSVPSHGLNPRYLLKLRGIDGRNPDRDILLDRRQLCRCREIGGRLQGRRGALDLGCGDGIRRSCNRVRRGRLYGQRGVGLSGFWREIGRRIDHWRRNLCRPRLRRGRQGLRIGARSLFRRGRGWLANVCGLVHRAAVLRPIFRPDLCQVFRSSYRNVKKKAALRRAS